MKESLATLLRPRIIPPKPLPPKKPNPTRRGENAKHMTIVFGVLQSNGILFAADMEETGQHMKLATPKLYSYSRSNGETLVIGGAGSPFSVETMQQRLGKTFVADSASFEEVAQIVIKQFHDEQVTVDPNQDFWLIFGGSFAIGENAYTHRLWISEHGSLREPGELATIGADSATEMARSLIGKLAPHSPRFITELSAVHILRLVKYQAHYCGKESMIWSLRGPDVLIVPNDILRRSEEMSRRYEELSANVFSSLFATEASLPYIDSRLRSLQSECGKIIGELKSHYASEREINRHFRDNPDDR